VQPDHDEAVKQLRVKDDRAERASLEIEDVMNRSLSQLTDQIQIPAHTLVVFNSLNWQRDALVETDLFPNPRLTDLTTQQEVPLQILYEKEKFLHVRFLAKELPSVGYKCFRIEYGKEPLPKPSVSEDRTFENSFYRITIAEDAGAVASIYDKQLRRELVDLNSPFRFGQYVYVTGGDRDTEAGTWETVLAYGGTQIIKSFLALPKAVLRTHAAVHGKLVRAEHLPWGSSVLLTSSAENTPAIETEIVLFDNEKKIEFRYRLHKNYTVAKEGVYFAFPVALATPAFAYASQQGWLNPARDLMKGGSLEWFSIQQWMAAYDARIVVAVVPIDASLASFGDINRGNWPGRFQPASGTLFSYVMNNYWDTNYRAGQGGHFRFHYVITSALSTSADQLSRMGWEEITPLETDIVTTQDKAVTTSVQNRQQDAVQPSGVPADANCSQHIDGKQESFLDIRDPNVLLETWKPAEDENGTILRFLDFGGAERTVTVRIPCLHLDRVSQTDAVERGQTAIAVVGDNQFDFTLHPHEIVTIRLVGGRK
jgi:hypothetical protein